ncbi:MAG: hypothetical protein K8E24_015030, partial [Methanobacterium paludis]|nr:hypothetical protein [Methanobacterium paludis]
MEVDGRFNLDKKLLDGRPSPKDFIIPKDEDILITDQHTRETPQGDLVEYTRTLGVVKNAYTKNGRLEFEWEPTDPGLINLVKAAKHPEKLFRYSPEHVPIHKTDEYTEGEMGILKSIAITNLPNDDDAITTRIRNTVMKILGKDNEGEDMEIEEVRKIVQEEVGKSKEDIDAFEERIKAAEDMSKAISKEDFEELKKIVKELPSKVGVVADKVDEIEKNMRQTLEGDPELREKLVKNIRTQVALGDEVVKNMSMSELK